MTVSAKVPVNRAGGQSGGSGGGPIPAPRVVNNRRLRTGGILLAVLLLVLGAALSGLALLSATRTSAYVAVGQRVPIGAQIKATDLTTVELSGGQGLSAIPASQIDSVIGRHAAVELVPGTLVAKAELNDKTLLTEGDAEVGIRATILPSNALKAGDQILLVPNSTNANAPAGTVSFNATLIDIGAPGTDGSVNMHVAVNALEAPTIVTYANGGLSIVLKPQG
jgi:hypothetical protein